MRSGLTFRTENKNRTTMGLPKINPVLFIIVILIVVFLSGIYLHLAWQSYQKNAESEALMLAQSLKATFHPEEILELTASAEDVGKEDYELMKKSLIRLTLTTNPIHFAYLMQNGTEKSFSWWIRSQPIRRSIHLPVKSIMKQMKYFGMCFVPERV